MIPGFTTPDENWPSQGGTGFQPVSFSWALLLEYSDHGHEHVHVYDHVLTPAP